MATKKKKVSKPKSQQDAAMQVTPEMIAAIRADVLKELKNAEEVEKARLEAEHKSQQSAHQKFLEQMYASKEPWVELQSWADTPQGVKVELEWNDAFVAYLKSQGIEGTDEDQVVQKWVTLLLMQVSDSMENPEDRSSKLE